MVTAHIHSNQPETAGATFKRSIQHEVMLVRLYVEALLIDSVLADAVWELWYAGVFTDSEAAWAWVSVACSGWNAPESSLSDGLHWCILRGW